MTKRNKKEALIFEECLLNSSNLRKFKRNLTEFILTFKEISSYKELFQKLGIDLSFPIIIEEKSCNQYQTKIEISDQSKSKYTFILGILIDLQLLFKQDEQYNMIIQYNNSLNPNKFCFNRENKKILNAKIKQDKNIELDFDSTLITFNTAEDTSSYGLIENIFEIANFLNGFTLNSLEKFNDLFCFMLSISADYLDISSFQYNITVKDGLVSNLTLTDGKNLYLTKETLKLSDLKFLLKEPSKIW